MAVHTKNFLTPDFLGGSFQKILSVYLFLPESGSLMKDFYSKRDAVSLNKIQFSINKIVKFSDLFIYDS